MRLVRGQQDRLVCRMLIFGPNSDIHPWDILINGERWAGKVRLIGFVDAFFLICYSGASRFEHGLVIYSQHSNH